MPNIFIAYGRSAVSIYEHMLFNRVLLHVYQYKLSSLINIFRSVFSALWVFTCMTLCYSAVALCLSVTSRCSVETTGRIVLVLEWRLPSIYAAPCVIRKFRYLQKIGYFHLDLCLKLRILEHFATAHRLSQHVANIVQQRWTLSAINWTVGSQLKPCSQQIRRCGSIVAKNYKRCYQKES